MGKSDVEKLIEIGFQKVGFWRTGASENELTYELTSEQARVLLDEQQALYAFIVNSTVVCIGKTSRTIRDRLAGYCRPGSSQLTNLKCNLFIREGISQKRITNIFAFKPEGGMSYKGIPLNIAAGLEDEFIKIFSPAWNGRKYIASELKSHSETSAPQISLPPKEINKPNPIANRPTLENGYKFEIKLGKAYYYQGIINPGVGASNHLGPEGSPIFVQLGSEGETVTSKIDRSANPNGSVRLVGGNSQFAKWFQKNFSYGDIVSAIVTSKSRILLLK